MLDQTEADETLMLRYRDGDAGAFAILYSRHKGSLHRFCLRMCNDKARAEEVYQDTWMNLIQAAERYRVEARFTTFLFQIARNRMIDLMRRDGREAFSLDDEEGQGVADSLAASSLNQPERMLDRKQDAARILAALDQLPPAQREAFLLHEEAELPLEEIAALTNVGRETVKSRLRYALARLREALGDSQ